MGRLSEIWGKEDGINAQTVSSHITGRGYHRRLGQEDRSSSYRFVHQDHRSRNATSSGVQPLAPEFVIKWWKKEAIHHPEVCFSTTAGVGTQNYLLVISSSQSYFNGLMPTTHQETDTSNSTSSVRADGTATDSQGESWNYTASGTVDTTTTTSRTVHENVPYTDNNVSLYMQLYDSHGTILRQDSHLYSTRTGGDAADSFGHNLGNALAAIHARAGLLNRMVKQVEQQQDSRAVFTPQQNPTCRFPQAILRMQN